AKPSDREPPLNKKEKRMGSDANAGGRTSLTWPWRLPGGQSGNTEDLLVRCQPEPVRGHRGRWQRSAAFPEGRLHRRLYPTHPQQLMDTRMTYATLETDLNDRVLTLRLHRPDRLNAFTVEMANELEHFFRAVNEDDAVGAIIVTGSGRAFCAGMELGIDGNVFGLDETLTPTVADMANLDDPVIRNGVRDTGGRVALAIHDCRKPVIAAINGAAVGIGATMTLAMDFRLASAHARIGFVF